MPLPTPFAVARALHIAFGALALVTFWIPLVTKKGGAPHRRAGWAFVAATYGIAVTGVVDCVGWLVDADPRNDAYAAFLVYIAILAAASATLGVRALGTKLRSGPRRHPIDLAFPAFLVLLAPPVALLGVGAGAPLFAVFAALGALVGVGQLRFWLRPPKTRTEWFFEHMSGMGVACTTTLTAFTVVNARHLGFGAFDVAVWASPAAIFGALFFAWGRYYRVRFARRGAQLSR